MREHPFHALDPGFDRQPVEPQRLARLHQQHVDPLLLGEIAQAAVAQGAFDDHRRAEGHRQLHQLAVARRDADLGEVVAVDRGRMDVDAELQRPTTSR
jgi:hypothetical protein